MSAEPSSVTPAAQKRKPKVRIYRLPNRLRQKAAPGGGKGPGELSLDVLKAAEAEFEKMAEDYPDWVQGHIRKLYDHHGRCVDSPKSRRQHFKDLNELAHDLKGQGGTFGYPLISDFGESLFECTRSRDDYLDEHVEIVKAHVDAMNAVVKGRINGDGGEVGTELKATLARAIEKFSVIE